VRAIVTYPPFEILQDCLVSIPLGMLLVLIQVLVSRNDLYSSLFEWVLQSLLPSISDPG